MTLDQIVDLDDRMHQKITEQLSQGKSWSEFMDKTTIELSLTEVEDMVSLCRIALRIRLILEDPHAVYTNMLRGGIAKPELRSMLELYGSEVLQRWDAAVKNNPL